MKDLFDREVSSEIIERLNKLFPFSQGQWGKMNASQMLAHCTAALEVATGHKTPARIFLGRILSPFFKSFFYGPKPFKKNSPTDKSFIIAGDRDFEKEKTNLITIITQFTYGGEERVTRAPHSFFGRLTPQQWSAGMYKHLDHHLVQFGV